MVQRVFATFRSVGVIFGVLLSLLMTFEGSAQDFASANVLPIGVTHQTVAHAAVVRYGYFNYTPYRSSSSHQQAQVFKVGQPKFALPSANPTRPMAFNSRAADAILSNLGEALGGILGGLNYRSPQSSYHDKYALRVGTKP